MARRLSRLSRLFLLFILAASMWGCADAGFIIKNMEPLMDELNVSMNKSSDVEMLRDAMPANLVQLDGFIEAAPNTKLLLRTSEAYFGYTFAFVEETNKKRASMLYLKARDYALDVLLQERYFRENFNKGIDEFRGSLDEFGKKDVPSLYWAANNWMAWIALNLNNPEVLLDIPKVEAMLLRAVDLDETYYYGGAHATLGAFYASRAKAIGGDPEKARYHFQRAFKLSRSKVLFIHLLYAQYYAYQVQDRDLFVKTLEAVVATPVGYFPEKNFANEIAKRKAQKLLEDVDMYF